MRVCAGSVPDVDPGRHPESDGVNQRVDKLWNKSGYAIRHLLSRLLG